MTDQEREENELLEQLDREDDYWAACSEAAKELERHRMKGWPIH